LAAHFEVESPREVPFPTSIWGCYPLLRTFARFLSPAKGRYRGKNFSHRTSAWSLTVFRPTFSLLWTFTEFPFLSVMCASFFSPDQRPIGGRNPEGEGLHLKMINNPPPVQPRTPSTAPSFVVTPSNATPPFFF